MFSFRKTRWKCDYLGERAIQATFIGKRTNQKKSVEKNEFNLCPAAQVQL